VLVICHRLRRFMLCSAYFFALNWLLAVILVRVAFVSVGRTNVPLCDHVTVHVVSVTSKRSTAICCGRRQSKKSNGHQSTSHRQCFVRDVVSRQRGWGIASRGRCRSALDLDSRVTRVYPRELAQVEQPFCYGPTRGYIVSFIE
jgi:hypothetical protein